MNLIGNCCISNFLLRLYGFGNTNPFAWVDMDFDSFYNLLTGYDSIDWENIALAHRPHPYTSGQEVFDLIIDGRVKLTFIHMIWDTNAKVPVKCGSDIRYCKIWELIVKKYLEHLKTMLDSGKAPMFVLEWEHLDYDEMAFEKLLKTDLKYKVVVITYNQKFRDVKKDNLLVIYDPHGRGGGYVGAGNRLPDWYANVYKDAIREFLLM